MSQHHQINYIEFYVTNLNRAKIFYSQAFGWEFTDYAPHYSGIKNPQGGEMGGFEEQTSIQTGGPLVVLFSDHLEETLDRVKSAEGVISKEIFEFPGGRRFHFKDPSGNELAVWGK